MFYVVSYDISDDKRRHRVCATLKNYGTRVQYSVFECELEPARRAELERQLAKLVEPQADHLRYYRLCKDCLAQTVAVGDRPLTSDPDYWIV